MNGFELHGIEHTSPSQINTWANAPCYWMATKLLGHRFPMGPAVFRGSNVEDAVVNIIANGWDAEKAIESAIKRFDQNTALDTSPMVDKERNAIAPMVELAVEALEEYGVPEFPDRDQQHKVELTCVGDGWRLPVIGYLDLFYPDQGLVIDLKTTHRAPSKMSLEHERQAAIYSQALGNQAVKFMYVTPKKVVTHECPDVPSRLQEIKQILNRQERFLKLEAEPQKLKELIPVNAESFRWSHPEAAKTRKELYGI